MILFRTSVITVGLASAMAVGACRTSDDPSSGRTPAAAPQIATTGPQQDELPRSPRADVGRLEKLAAAIGLADGLPDLKPVIDKPFPEGATEEQVCEAIANTGEKDLWVRFGHLVPMYMPGSLFIVRARVAEVDAIADIMLDDMVYPNYKSCRGETVLIYSFGLPDVTREMDGIVSGRIPLIEKFSKRLGVETLESFSFDGDRERLSEYCRADAELCEKLVKLNASNDGKGLCSLAILRARLTVPDEVTLLNKCKFLPRSTLACAHYAFDGPEADRCRATIRRALSDP